MYLMVVNHDVEDFESWKTGFDLYPPTRAGALFQHVLRNADKPDNVAVVCGWDSQDRAVTFRDSPELKAAMDNAGIVNALRVEIFEEVEQES